MALLDIVNLDSFHGDLQALFGVSMQIEAGQIVALIGANGAGKSTLIDAVAGFGRPRADAFRFQGSPIDQLPAERIAHLGIALVPEGRQLFASLSVEENLLMGSQTRRPGPWDLDTVYAIFPILREFRHRLATSLSGGQQQMVSIGRALMSNPSLLLCDEVSQGLAPIVVEQIYRTFLQLRARGISVLLVEQDVGRACGVADQVHCLLKGRITLSGRPDQLSQTAIAAAYFGA